jgi:hypothetical protein
MVRGLVAGCHPGPTLVVTAAITALALALGRGPIGGLEVLPAVLSGQLSVGWANDAFDAERDRQAQRWDKPVVRGWVSEHTLWVAAGLAATACIPLSLLAGGVIGGAAHILAVASAWAYDLWLKTTVWSFVPYMVSFGLVAPFLTYGLTPPQAPAGWAIATLSLLGLGAHLANGIPDIDTDRATDSHGLVGRLGGRLSANLAVVALLAATALLVGHLDLPPAAAIAVLSGLAAVSVLAATAAGGRHLFQVVMLLALTDALLLSVNARILIGG